MSKSTWDKSAGVSGIAVRTGEASIRALSMLSAKRCLHFIGSLVDLRCSIPASFQYVNSAFCSKSLVARKRKVVSLLPEILAYTREFALTLSLSVARELRETYFPANVLREDSLIVIKCQVIMPRASTKGPTVMLQVDTRLVVDNASWWPVVIVKSDGSILQVSIALIARLSVVSIQNKNDVRHSLRSLCTRLV